MLPGGVGRSTSRGSEWDSFGKLTYTPTNPDRVGPSVSPWTRRGVLSASALAGGALLLGGRHARAAQPEPHHDMNHAPPAPGAPGTTPQTLSSPLVVEFQLRPDPLAH